MENVEEEIRFVYDGDNNEYILSASEFGTQELNDIEYPDGTKAFFINAPVLQNEEQTIFLHDGEILNQFNLNKDDQVQDDSNFEPNLTMPESQVDFIQYYDENSTEGQLVYIHDLNQQELTSEGNFQQEFEILPATESNEYEGDYSAAKRLKLTHDEVMDLEEFLQNEEEMPESNTYQYAVLKDGKLHIQTSANNEEIDITTTVTHVEEKPPLLDISKITGRNLLTGQTLTLDNYLFNCQHSTVEAKAKRKRDVLDPPPLQSSPYKSLLNKKLTLGKTADGRVLIGRVIKVEKRLPEVAAEPPTIKEEQEPEEEIVQEVEEEQIVQEEEVQIPDPKVGILNENLPEVTSEGLENINHTLGGLMNISTVKKKLIDKLVVVKLIHKNYNHSTNKFDKYVSYSSGFMDKENLENGEIKWKYVSITTESHRTKQLKGNTKLSITIMLQKNNERTIRVALNPSNLMCSFCGKECRTRNQLRTHLISIHNLNGANCKICGQNFSDITALEEHKLLHINEGQLFSCDECKKTFSTKSRLKRHLLVHLNPNNDVVCDWCSFKCGSETVLKKHMLLHSTVEVAEECEIESTVNVKSTKSFWCEVCGRSFSRQSNLARHVEIHKGAGALYNCDICGCAYHFMASLTRHMVLNHIASQTKNEIQGEPVELTFVEKLIE